MATIGDSNNNKDPNAIKRELLLEEWKQNIALYIDQDKRGQQRITVFLTINGALLVLYGALFAKDGGISLPSLFVLLMTCIAAICFLRITLKMAKRAHAFIHLRKVQGMLIEKKLKEMDGEVLPWETQSGIITTFTREHVAFQETISEDGDYKKAFDNQPQPDDWQPLLDEIKKLGKSAGKSVLALDEWDECHTMQHWEWLQKIHYALTAIWTSLAIIAVLAYSLQFAGFR